MNTEFVERLRKLFGHASMADIARRIEVPHATIRNYFQGRLPAPEVLIKLARETGVSLNWLLTGEGKMFAEGERPLDLGALMEERITQIVDERLSQRMAPEVQQLGEIDLKPDFDVIAAVRQTGEPQAVMRAWYEHEGREYPEDFGVVFFQGWESFTPEERVDAVRDAKKVLDRALRAQGDKSE